MDNEILRAVEHVIKTQMEPIQVQLELQGQAIIKLERLSEQMVVILTSQARQDEVTKHLRDDIQKCAAERDDLYSKFREVDNAIRVNTPRILAVEDVVKILKQDEGVSIREILKYVLTIATSVAIAYFMARGR